MIFITVGTHEQQFDRLVSKLDECIEKKIIKEEVFIQRGFSTYVPRYCDSDILLPSEKMADYYKYARIIITHGGPCSIINSIKYGKIPIVVPRNATFGEHVDNHQIFFTQFLEKKGKIIAIYEIEKLPAALTNYAEIVSSLVWGEDAVSAIDKKTKIFCQKLDDICATLLS